MFEHGWFSYIRYDEKRDRPSVDRALLRRVAGYARPYLRRILLMLGTIFAISLLSLIPPLLYKDLIDNALPNRDFNRLNLLAIGMIGIPLLNGLVGVLQRFLSASIGEGVIFDLRVALYRRLQSMSLRFFTNTKTGELMSRLNNDVVGAQQAVTSTMVNILSNAIALVSTLVIMLSLEWRLTLLAIAILPAFVLPSRRVGRVLRRLTRESLTRNAQMNALMNETLNVSGALLVKLFGRAPDETGRFSHRAAQVRDIGIQQALVGRWFFLGLSVAGAVGTAVVFWLGGHLVLQEGLTIGILVAFGMYVTQLYGPLSSLTNARVEFVTSMVSFERVFEVLDLPVEIADRPDAKAPQRLSGHVVFDDVSFAYRGDETVPGQGLPMLEEVERWGWHGSASSMNVPLSRPKPADGNGQHGPDGARAGNPDVTVLPQGPRWALRHVSFEARPGQLVALVGPSGAGKTTITYLLPRLYDPTEGRILIDGDDLRDLKLSVLADNIGMVTQEAYLFHDTIRTNLLYARPQATQEEIEAACRAAHIHDFILRMPEGYETIVGERGYRLSGGEKQRVAIARVLLKNPSILVLDEATSHLDSESEALIQSALEKVMLGRTSLVIAHRLSTILAADMILVMDDGRLVESGRHEELLEENGLYARLYRTQFERVSEPHAN